ncbi:MAG TPA: type I pullulanase [Spirochaetota bacterium]|nr:type I pullulanase [Spirochaetota bacterium]
MHISTNCEKVKIVSALMDDYITITVYFSMTVMQKETTKITLLKEGNHIDFSIRSVFENKVVINTEHLDIKKLYTVCFEKSEVEVIPHKILDQKEFIYTGNDLGVTYSKEKSVFKVFAPTATKIQLNIFDCIDTNKKDIFKLVEKDFGIWSVEVNKDLKAKFYSYNVTGSLSVFDENREVVDPYSKCVIGKTRKSMIVDLNDYPKNVKNRSKINYEDLVIYEIHFRDISIDKSSGTQHSGKYLALTENSTYLNGDKKSNIKTLVGHFKELGVNTIQVMPIQDFENEEQIEDFYAWGYMPTFFDTPDGSYSSDWRRDVKIKEVKEAINNLHSEGFKVILDVVYNHTAEGFYGDGISSFNGFVPYYYYRFGGNGYVSNGSGCGNEFRSESPMGRKFIIDSLKYWTTFYDFDGYRFDLMGLIDLHTIEELLTELKKVKDDIIIYGEPWTGGTTPIQPTYKGSQKNRGFSVFNDEYRDAIKGAVFNKKEKGYVQTKGQYNYDKIIQGILGSINTFAASPIETLNYVEVHDNNTLFDKLYFSKTEKEEFTHPEGEILKEIKMMHKLSAFLLLTSQGIPVLHLGQDFLRTKHGVENSYNSGDIINKIDWTRKKDFFDVFTYYKNLIEIRNKHPLFKISREHNLRESIEFKYDIFSLEYKNGISYILEGGKKYQSPAERLLILINPYHEFVAVNLCNYKFKKLLIGDNYYNGNIEFVGENLTLPPISGNILYI